MVGVGVVGAGFWPRLAQLPAFQSIPGWEIVGIASRARGNAEKLAREFGIPKVFADYSELIEDDDVDVVDIVTPNHLHREIAVRAMAAGKDVICIKPLAHTLEDAEEMVSASQRYQRRLFYAENVVFTPALRTFKRLVDEDTYGQLFRRKALHGVGVPHAQWFFDPELSGGGCVIDMAVHGLAFLDWFSGKAPVRSLFAIADTFVHTQYPVEDTSVIQVRYEDGSIGQTEDSWATPGGFDLRYEVFGTKGHGFADLLYGHPIRSVVDGHAEGGSTRLRYHSAEDHFIKDGHRAMMQHFLDVLIHGVPCESGALEGLRAMQMVDAAYRSIRSGAPTRVDLVCEI